MSDIDALIAEMRAGLDGVTPGFPLWIWLFGDRTVYTRDPSDGCRISAVVRADCIGQNTEALAHIARCSPGNIARLLGEIEALRTQLATVLARESATTARYDARIAEVEAYRDQARFEWGKLSRTSGQALADQLNRAAELEAENARLREALNDIGRQKLDAEMTVEEFSNANLSEGYEGCVRRAREALK